MSKTSPNHAEAWSRFREFEETAKNKMLDQSDSDITRRICVAMKVRGFTNREIAPCVGLSYQRVAELTKGVARGKKDEEKVLDEDKETFLDSIAPEASVPDEGGERRSGPKGHK